jgi:outer membrane protein TolC
LATAADARAEVPAPTRLTIEDAVALGASAHPALRAAEARERAAAARVEEARAGELPDVGLSAQLNRSTGNAVPGAFFSTPGFANIAGPARGTTLDAGAFQTGAAVWASWDVSTFLQRSAAADVASATRREAEATTAERRLAVQFAVADAFLGVIAAQTAVEVARANVRRARVLASMVKPLVDQNLRPGVDMARAQADVALAETQVARAQQTEEVRSALLAQTMGIAGRQVEAVAGRLLDLPGRTSVPAAPNADHPLLAQSDSAVQRATQAKRAALLEYVPHVSLVGSLWLRGGGLGPVPSPVASGLVPDTPNWAAAVIVSWSALEVLQIRARNRVAGANEAVAIANRDGAKLGVDGDLAAAQAMLRGSLRVAQNTAPALTAAQAAEQQAIARYQAGLSPVIDVADAERLLAQAEGEDALARVEVWRALLVAARAVGDIELFLASARGSVAGGG